MPAPNPRRVRIFLHIAGERDWMADIVTPSTLDFAVFISLPIPQECTKLRAWHARVANRPSAAA